MLSGDETGTIDREMKCSEPELEEGVLHTEEPGGSSQQLLDKRYVGTGTLRPRRSPNDADQELRDAEALPNFQVRAAITNDLSQLE